MTINDNRRARGLPPVPGGEISVQGEQFELPEQTNDGGNRRQNFFPEDPKGSPHPDVR